MTAFFTFEQRWHGFFEFIESPKHFFLVTILVMVCGRIGAIIGAVRKERNIRPIKPDVCNSFVLKHLEELSAPTQSKLDGFQKMLLETFPLC